MFFSFKFEPIFAGPAQSVLDEFAPFKVLSHRLTTENCFLFTAVVKSRNTVSPRQNAKEKAVAIYIPSINSSVKVLPMVY